VRSKFEQKVRDDLISKGVKFEYEPYSFSYYEPIRNGECLDCKSRSCVKERWYTPDWLIRQPFIGRDPKDDGGDECQKSKATFNHEEMDTRIFPDFATTTSPGGLLQDSNRRTGIYIETKGLFTSENRKTILLSKEANEELEDIRLIFMRDNKIHKKSTMRYSTWCENHNIKYSVGAFVPNEWLKELGYEIT